MVAVGAQNRQGAEAADILWKFLQGDRLAVLLTVSAPPRACLQEHPMNSNTTPSNPSNDPTTILPAFDPPQVAPEYSSVRQLPKFVRRQRRMAVGAGAAAAILLIIGCTAGKLTSDEGVPAQEVSLEQLAPTDSTSAPSTDTDTTAPVDTTDTTEPADEATEDGLGESDDSEGFGDGGEVQEPPVQPEDADDPVELEPVDEPQAHPCDTLPAGASLLVQPDPLVLPNDQMVGAVSITNCSEGDVDWTAATKPSIHLESGGANLLPGETTELGFNIDEDAWDPGAIEFKIKVSEPGANHYVDVHAYDTLFGSEAVAGNGDLSAGEGVGGCGNQCITSAWLVPNLTTPNVTLEVRTNTPAKMKTWVSKNAPSINDDIPSFGALLPKAVSADGLQSWSIGLQQLQAETKYYIIVSATDADGETAYRWTGFTTSSPAQNPGGIVSPDGPSGCAAQCITSAVITPGGEEGDKHLAVASHTAARFQVYVGPNAPVKNGNDHSMVGSTFWANSGEQYETEWEVELVDLAPSSLHHILVIAEDVQGRVSYRIGQFHTPAAALHGTMVILHRIEVGYDGDSGANRGEVSFAWGFADTTVGTWGERKVDNGYVLTPDSHNSWVLWGVGDFKPTVYVNTAERDADGLLEFCSGGTGPFTSPLHIGSCDLSINVASSGIITDDAIVAMPRCVDLGVTGVSENARCTWVESTVGEGYDTEFRALISYENF
jgi:hypothetical protein